MSEKYLGSPEAEGLHPLSHTVDYTQFVTRGFAKRYLTTYFKGIDADEQAITEFLVREYKKIEGASALLDLGCGPGIQHVLPAVPYVDRIDMADFLPDNLAELRSWLAGSPDSHDWNHFTRLILESEGKLAEPQAIAKRESELRSKLGAIEHVDVLREFPLGEPRRYPAIGFFYCAEAAARTKEQWAQILTGVTPMIERGGFLFMASLRNADYYTVNHPDAAAERIPTASINERDFAELLPSLGFGKEQTLIEVVPVPAMADHGIDEILLVSARKNAADET